MTKTDLKSIKLANFIYQTQWENIPQEIQKKSLEHLTDTLGALIAGSASLESALLVRGLNKIRPPKDGENSDPAAMAMIWGVQSHAFELDDTGGCDHSGAVIIPALLSAVMQTKKEGVKVSGKEFLCALIIGYDIARRALEACGGYEPHNKAGFHSTGTCGPFGAAAAAAKILRLQPTVIQNALGLSSSFSSGLWSCVHNGAQSKRIHPGHAAQGGFLSAILAREGFTGPDQVFENVWGSFENSFAPNSSDSDAWLRDLGTKWRLARVSIKPYASCRSTHSSIDAVKAIKEELQFNNDEIESIMVCINPFVYGMCGHYSFNPMGASQLSIPFSIATFLLYGDATLGSFLRDKRNDPRILPLLNLVHFKVDESQTDEEEPSVTVKLKDGRTLTKKILEPLGAPTNPVAHENLIQKFSSCAEIVFDKQSTNRIIQRLETLHSSDDVYESLRWCFEDLRINKILDV